MNVRFIPQTEEAAGLLRAYGPLKAVSDQYGWNVQLWPHKRQTGRDFALLNVYTANRDRTVGLDPRKTYTFFRQEAPPEDFDMVLMHQPLNDHAHMIQECKARGVTIVVDCDDDYLHIPPEYPTRQALAAGAYGHNVRNLEHAIRSADLVTVSTPALAETYRHWNPNITVIRNGLWWPMWENVEHEERDYPTIGYVGGLQYRRFDLTVLRGIVGPWLRRHPEWRFVSIGADGDEVHDYLEVPEDRRVTRPWGEYGDGWAATVGLIDIGLVPLQRNRFNDGKSHLKGLEHNAVGRVFIASPSESYDWWVNEKHAAGTIARRANQWVHRLDMFASGTVNIDANGQFGRRQAQGWSIQQRACEWHDAWLQAIEQRRKAA